MDGLVSYLSYFVILFRMCLKVHETERYELNVMCRGTSEGDSIVVVVKTMEASQISRSAHTSPVTDIAFSKHGR